MYLLAEIVKENGKQKEGATESNTTAEAVIPKVKTISKPREPKQPIKRANIF
jgi:hypothetical protein